jgi:glyoxylase-like metal-dependent hydrolase (beta-lactamase superfamily II)
VVSARVRTVRAPNPSAMTLDGTNTYVVDLGGGRGAVIDPGPPHAGHLDAIQAALAEAGLTPVAILVTHGHPDHYPGAAPLAERTGAPVHAHRVARFAHDRSFDDGDLVVEGPHARLTAVHTPGHSRDSATFVLSAGAEAPVLMTGDLVIGRGTVVVAPPGGDMRVYQASLRALRERYAHAAAIYGGHGERVDDVAGKLDEYLAHRASRERQIVETLANGPCTIPELTARVYAAVDRALWPAAARQVLAYLLALETEGAIARSPVARAASAEERAILDPDLSKLADPGTAAVARAELGYDDAGEPLELFALR